MRLANADRLAWTSIQVELEEDLEVLVVGALQDHDQLTVQRGVAEQLGEVRAAGRQHQPVRLE